jgi:hypothetical protein
LSFYKFPITNGLLPLSGFNFRLKARICTTVLLLLFGGTGYQLRASCTRGKCSPTELHFQPFYFERGSFLAKLPRLSSSSRTSCFSLLRRWDHRHAPPMLGSCYNSEILVLQYFLCLSIFPCLFEGQFELIMRLFLPSIS